MASMEVDICACAYGARCTSTHAHLDLEGPAPVPPVGAHACPVLVVAVQLAPHPQAHTGQPRVELAPRHVAVRDAGLERRLAIRILLLLGRTEGDR